MKKPKPKTPPATLARIAKWKRENTDKVRAHRKTYRETHPHVVRDWKRAHPEQVKVYRQRAKQKQEGT